ncbi:MAG: hypothetical protein ACYCOO_04300 [Chitinophagaceae bacterium]
MNEPRTLPENELRFSFWLRGIAQVFSYLFHPVLMPLYLTLLLIHFHPLRFADFSSFAFHLLLFSIAVNTIIFPVVTTLLCRKLGFIDSIFLRSAKDRIIPYIATMIYYFWLYEALKGSKIPLGFPAFQQIEVPHLLLTFLLGNFIAVIFGFFCNIFFKISMHTLAAGGLIGLMLTQIAQPFPALSSLMIAAIFLVGIIATSRMILSAHNNLEIYSGIALGILAQLLAVFFI